MENSSTPVRHAIIILAIIFSVLYLPDIWLPSLRRGEAALGTVAREIAARKSISAITFHGQEKPLFPGYPLAIAICAGFNPARVNATTTRLPAALAVFGMALLAAWMARLHAGDAKSGRLAATIAGAMVLSNIACLRVGQRAQTETLFAFFLSAAWFSWFHFGLREEVTRRRWGLAWGLSLFFVVLACTVGGARALLVFYLPFFFLKKPLRGRDRLMMFKHFAALFVLIIVLIWWQFSMPSHPFMPWNQAKIAQNSEEIYLVGRALFILKIMIYLLPWVFLAWTPFCLAFRVLENNPPLFRYLRTIVFVKFICSWLIPGNSPLVLLPVLPSLAVMTGLHFSIAQRRYQSHLDRLYRGMLKIATVSACLGVLLSLTQVSGLIRLAGMKTWAILISGGTFLIITIFSILLLRVDAFIKKPFWIRFMMAAALLRLIFIAADTPADDWRGNERKHIGMILGGRAQVDDFPGINEFVEEENLEETFAAEETEEPPPPEASPLEEAEEKDIMLDDLSDFFETEVKPQSPEDGMTAGEVAEKVSGNHESAANPLITQLPERVRKIYFISKQDRVVETFYTGRTIQRVKEVNGAFPEVETEVYVLTESNTPAVPERIWTPIGPVLDVNQKNKLLWKWLPGGFCLLEVRPVTKVNDDYSYLPSPIRMYRGELRQ